MEAHFDHEMCYSDLFLRVLFPLPFSHSTILSVILSSLPLLLAHFYVLNTLPTTFTNTDRRRSQIPSMFQQFRSKDGESLQSVQSHTIGRFGDCFVYWSDIQDAFTDINYLEDKNGDRVLFEVVKNGDDYEL